MNIDEARLLVKPQMPEKRYEHTLRVAETAVKLARTYHISEYKAELAAIFHDYAKYRPVAELKRWIINSQLPKDLLQYHHELWHGPVGSILIEREHGITDRDIQSAIYYHTTGKPMMSKLEMIIFIADYIEPGRSFPGLDEVRAIAHENLEETAWMIAKNTIQFLMGKNSTIYPDTLHAYNDLTKRMNGGKH